MNRIYIPETVLKQSPLAITGEIHHQIGRVLRSRPGDHIIAINGDGCEYELLINKIDKEMVHAEVLEKTPVDNEPSVKITLYQGNLKGKSMEEITPSLVYLGILKVIPVNNARSEGFFDPGSGSGKKRVDGIIGKATALCHRTKLMEVCSPMNFKEALQSCRSNLLNFIFWESEEPVPLKSLIEKYLSSSAIQKHKTHLEENVVSSRLSIGLFTGPEGGYTPEEIEMAREAGVISASLGKRILDAKTAPVTAVSALLYELGDL